MTQGIELDGHDLLARCSPEYDDAARSLLDKLAQLHRAGPVLRPGSHIDFGWSMLQIEEHPGHWVVCEPDYGSDPLAWKPQVDETLHVLQQQAALHALLGYVRSQRTRGDQWLLVQPDAFSAAESYLHRSAGTTAQDSGWYIGVENAPEGEPVAPARPLIAGRLCAFKPEWLSVLALPVGYLAHFKEGRLADIYDEQQRCVFPPESDHPPG